SLIDCVPDAAEYCRPRQGKSPLHLAAEGGHAKVVGLLLQRGSVLLKATSLTPKKTPTANTALHLVAKQGHIDVAKLILAVNHGIIDAKNRLEVAVPQSFKTPTVCCFFNYATKSCEREVVAAVIQHERWKEILWNVGPNHCPIFETVKFLPECTEAMLMFDQVDLLTHPAVHRLSLNEVKLSYIVEPTNLMWLAQHCCSLAFAAPFWLGHSTDPQWKAGSAAVLLAWVNFVMFFPEVRS
uniref:ANK_REP_REGION domain-containing protein n=1 Tax=Macrostomum lignano TaxID=282301 RepID=A0A1I8FJR6_9PLAT